MQEFVFGRMKAQEAAPEPYTIYDKENSPDEPKPENMMLRDFEYFKSMYPARIKELQLHVEAVCDEMDYEGSSLFDEYPDRLMVEQLRRKVELRLEKENGAETKPADAVRTSYGPQAAYAGTGSTEDSPYHEADADPLIMTEARRPGNLWGPPPLPPGPGNPWGPPPPPPRPGNPWGPPPPPPRPGNPWGPPPRPGNPWGPPPPPPRPGNPWGPPPRPGKNTLGDLISLLLFGEMQRRRCRSRFCR